MHAAKIREKSIVVHGSTDADRLCLGRRDCLRSVESDFSIETEHPLDLLDNAFFKQPNDLTQLLFAFVSKHPEEFGELPKPENE
jgi:hypothetical protein